MMHITADTTLGHTCWSTLCHCSADVILETFGRMQSFTHFWKKSAELKRTGCNILCKKSRIHKWTNINTLFLPLVSCFLPPKSVLTSRYTHPLPHYGDIHRSDMGKQHKHTFPEARTHSQSCGHLQSTRLHRKPADASILKSVKKKKIPGREVVTASLVLTSP